MLISLLSLVGCLVMLASSCYAWFTAVQGAKINIEAGIFGVKAVVSSSVEVVSQSDVVVGDSVTRIVVEATGSESAIVRIKNGGTYQISLTATGEASKGFCKVTVTVKGTEGQTIGESKVYHTDPILKAGAEFAFTLVSTESGTTEITIQPSWGEYEYQKESDVVSTLITGTITVTGEVEAPVENIAEIVPEETSTVDETTAEETTGTVETTDAESSAEAETTVNVTVESPAETVETVLDTTEADTTEAVETAETAAPTTEVETTVEETTEAEESTEVVETTEVAETTTEVETSAEETTEAAETTAEMETTAVETAETSAEETTAEASTESLSAEE